MIGRGNMTQAGSAEGFPRVGRSSLQKGTQGAGTWKSYKGGLREEE